MSSLFKLLEEFDTSLTKQKVTARDFDLFFESKLEAQGGNPTFLDLCDIWWVRNMKSQQFTFTQKHSSDFNAGSTIY